MNRKLIGAVMTAAVLAMPIYAKGTKNTALAQCKSEYSAAKKANASKTGKERAAANKEAKKAYKDCSEKAKVKS